MGRVQGIPVGVAVERHLPRAKPEGEVVDRPLPEPAPGNTVYPVVFTDGENKRANACDEHRHLVPHGKRPTLGVGRLVVVRCTPAITR